MDPGSGSPERARVVVVASSASDPDLAPFVGAAHLGASFVLWRPGDSPALGYLSPMERDEAAATGCRLLTPEALEVRQSEQQAAGRPELWTALLRRAFGLVEWEPGPVEVAGRSQAGDLLEALRPLEAEGWSFRSGHDRILGRRKTKTDRELEGIQSAARGVIAAFRSVAELLAAAQPSAEDWLVGGEPLVAGRLRAAAAAELAAHGLEQPHGNIFALGRAAAVPHTAGADDRRLRSGEALIVDLFPRGRLYADCTRTFCLGEPAASLRRAHAEVLAALEAARRGLVPGRRAGELHAETSERFERAGFRTQRTQPDTEKGYVHGLGHGVGYELHEWPSFRPTAPGASGTLAVGDVLTLEPGLYDPEEGWGVRLEDLFHLSADGPQWLTPLPYDLDPRAW